jgi:hypothetical protein
LISNGGQGHPAVRRHLNNEARFFEMVSQQFGHIHLVFNNQNLLTHLTQRQLGHRTIPEKFGASLKRNWKSVENRTRVKRVGCAPPAMQSEVN